MKDYPSVGRAAFGTVGFVVATIGQYSLLVGASIIFVVLIGNFLHEIICTVPSRFFMLCVGLVSFVIVFTMPALKKVN